MDKGNMVVIQEFFPSLEQLYTKPCGVRLHVGLRSETNGEDDVLIVPFTNAQVYFMDSRLQGNWGESKGDGYRWKSKTFHYDSWDEANYAAGDKTVELVEEMKAHAAEVRRLINSAPAEFEQSFHI